MEEKEKELKTLIEKVEVLIAAALLTDNQTAHMAANDVYNYLNQKFIKYLE